MKTIEVKEFSAPLNLEYSVSEYPGDGAYLNRNGSLYFVKGTTICWVAADHTVLRDNSSGNQIDVHRFLDQLIALK